MTLKTNQKINTFKMKNKLNKLEFRNKIMSNIEIYTKIIILLLAKKKIAQKLMTKFISQVKPK